MAPGSGWRRHLRLLYDALPAGNYETKVAINETWDENYGLNGVPGGANIGFTVPKSCSQMFFVYDSKTHVLTSRPAARPKET